MFDFRIVTTWFDELLRITCGLGNFWTVLIECVVVGLAILLAYALLAIVLIFMERKVCAYFQCRIGPVRVGWWGTLQVFADVLKMLIKEIFAVDMADCTGTYSRHIGIPCVLHRRKRRGEPWSVRPGRG